MIRKSVLIVLAILSLTMAATHSHAITYGFEVFEDPTFSGASLAGPGLSTLDGVVISATATGSAGPAGALAGASNLSGNVLRFTQSTTFDFSNPFGTFGDVSTISFDFAINTDIAPITVSITENGGGVLNHDLFVTPNGPGTFGAFFDSSAVFGSITAQSVTITPQVPGVQAIDNFFFEAAPPPPTGINTDPADGGTLDLGIIRENEPDTFINGSFDVTNNEPGSELLFLSDSGDFTAFFPGPAADVNLGAGATTQVDVTAGAGRGTYNGQVTVVGNPNNSTVNVTGRIVGPTIATTFDPDFGEVSPDDESSQGFDVENNGDEGFDIALNGLTLIEVDIFGDDADLFSVVGFTPGTVLAPDDPGLDDASFSVVFNPDAGGPATLGEKTATLRLVTDLQNDFGSSDNLFGIIGVTQFELTGVVVPEPATLVLFAPAIALLCRRRRG